MKQRQPSGGTKISVFTGNGNRREAAMMNLRGRGMVEASSSNGFRNAILARHDVLRGLVADTVHLTDRRAGPRVRPRDVDVLRERARDLFLTLDANLTFEERTFPAALRDIIGWGPVLQEQIHETHEHQRQVLAGALSALDHEPRNWAQLARDVCAVIESVLRDLEKEEAALLDADLDFFTTDGEGG
jgi:hypothetical protein